MNPLARRFLQPESPAHRQYEALRAHFVENLSMQEATECFGYRLGTFRNLCTAFRKNPDRAFFETRRPCPRRKAELPGHAERRDRAVALRKQRNLPVEEISAVLAREGMPTSVTAVNRILREAGLPKLWRRTPAQREEARPERAPVADRGALDLSPRSLRTGFGGLFLFAADLARCDLDGMLAQAGMPGSAMIPAGCAFRSMLALKLWGIGRPPPHHGAGHSRPRHGTVRRPQRRCPSGRQPDRIFLPCRSAALCRASWSAGTAAVERSRHRSRRATAPSISTSIPSPIMAMPH